MGSLSANGHVYLINPEGIVFGQGAQVNAGALIASTLDILDQDFEGAFAAGSVRFRGRGGTITNRGTLDAGVVALIAPVVRQAGTIIGDAALAGGTDVTLDFDGDGLIGVRIDAATVETLVENSGLVQADGGLVVLTARGASDAMRGVVRNSGTIQAQRLSEQDGRILLLGDMSHGEVAAGGTMTAPFVETSAAAVKFESDLRIDTQGGEWLIDPVDIVIDEGGATAIGRSLLSGNVTVRTDGDSPYAVGDGPGDIYIEAPIQWSKHILTLEADRNIYINAPLTSEGETATDGLALRYGGDYFVRQPVNLKEGSHFSTKRGNDPEIVYTVITRLGVEDPTVENDTLHGMRLDGYYVLGADIDATPTRFWHQDNEDYRGFVPKAWDGGSFSGIFDGLGHVIKGLYIYDNRPMLQDAALGLFGRNSGIIRNVGIVEGQVASDREFAGERVRPIGGLVGLNSGTIENVFFEGTVKGFSRVGGLVGHHWDDPFDEILGIIKGSYFSGEVIGKGAVVGGLAGLNGIPGNRNIPIDGIPAYIEDSYAVGTISGADKVGGIAGEVWGQVRRTYFVGSVSGAGIAGFMDDYDSRIESSFYHGSDVPGCNTWFIAHCDAHAVDLETMQHPFHFFDRGWDLAHTWGKPIAGENDGMMMLRNLSRQAPMYDDYVRLNSFTKRYHDVPDETPSAHSGVGLGNVTIQWGPAAETLPLGEANLLDPGVLEITTTSKNGVYVVGAPLLVLPRMIHYSPG